MFILYHISEFFRDVFFYTSAQVYFSDIESSALSKWPPCSHSFNAELSGLSKPHGRSGPSNIMSSACQCGLTAGFSRKYAANSR